jgi:hypothetical protein
VFEQWCHVATVHSDADLWDCAQTRTALAFDLDTYRLLLRHLHPSPTGPAGGLKRIRAVAPAIIALAAIN